MKKKKLVTEINRVRELMSLQILNENVITKLKVLVPEVESLAVRRSLKSTFTNLIDDLKTAIKNSDEVLYIQTLRNMAKESDEFLETILKPKVMNSLSPDEKKLLDDFYDSVLKDVVDGKVIYSNAKKMLDDYPKSQGVGEFSDIISNNYKKQLDDALKQLPQFENIFQKGGKKMKEIGKEAAIEFKSEFFKRLKGSDTIYYEAFKRVFNLIFTGNGKYNKKWMTQVDPGFWSRVGWWLSTGSTKNIIKEFKLVLKGQKGFHILITDYAASAFARWAKIYIALGILQVIKSALKDDPNAIGDQEFLHDVSTFFKVSPPSMHWSLPFPYFWDTIFEITSQGIPTSIEETKNFLKNIDTYFNQFTRDEKNAWDQLEKTAFEGWYKDLNTITPKSLDFDAPVVEKRLTDLFGKYGFKFSGSYSGIRGFTIEDAIEITLPDGKTKKTFNIDNLTYERDAAVALKIKNFMQQGIVEDGSEIPRPNLTIPSPQPSPNQGTSPAPQPAPNQGTSPAPQPAPNQGTGSQKSSKID